MTYPDDIVDHVINADCKDVMTFIPNRSVDLIVTDPPYGINYNAGNDLASNMEKVFSGEKEQRTARPIIGDDEEGALKLFMSFLVEAERILKPGACCCVCCSGGGGERPRFAQWSLLMDIMIGFKQAVVWDKITPGLGLKWRRSYEFILIAQKKGGPLTFNGGSNTQNIFHIPKIIPSQDEHPTEKPISLMRKLVLLHSNPGWLVLDPFCGHGATAVACKETGRHFIAIDIEKKYCDVTIQKLEQETIFQQREEGVFATRDTEAILEVIEPEQMELL